MNLKYLMIILDVFFFNLILYMIACCSGDLVWDCVRDNCGRVATTFEDHDFRNIPLPHE